MNARQAFEAGPVSPEAVPTYAGPIWSSGKDSGLGYVRIEKGKIVEQGNGEPKGAAPAVILDGLHNYHTHVGDAFLKGRPLPRSLPALVKPGTGYKHRMLAATPRARIVHAMEGALRLYDKNGTRSLLDFREQGEPGLRMLEEATQGARPRPVVRALGRPTRRPPDREELASLLDAGHGLGISSVTDVGPDYMELVAEACHRARKPLAVHHSEDRREPAADVLRYDPALLIHLCKSTLADLRAIQRAGVPAVVCPTSNAFFYRQAPVAHLEKLGIPFYFGTDNAMLGGFDLIAEVARSRRRAPNVPDSSFLRALTTPVEKAIKGVDVVPRLPGVPERVVVLPRRKSRVVWGARPLVASR
jgi:cytosine/adenosine deaminase-related metal-dependent hydrolase